MMSCRLARLYTKGRKPTPCTAPVIRIRLPFMDDREGIEFMHEIPEPVLAMMKNHQGKDERAPSSA